MKRIIILLLLLASLVTSYSFAALCDAGDNRLGLDQYNGALHSYICNVEHCCVKGVGTQEDHACVKYGRAPAWDFTQSDQLIEDHDMTKYPDLAETGATSLEEIRNVYLTTMDQTMNCAVNRMKYQLNREMISGDVLGGEKLSDPVITSLEGLNEALLEKLKEDGCIEPNDDGDVRQQIKMTNSLMYEQCVYQYYMQYYSHVIEKNIGATFAQNDSGALSRLFATVFTGTAYAALDAKTPTEIAEAVRALKGRIAAESSISRRTLADAMDLQANIPQSYVPYTLLKIMEMQATEARRYQHIWLRAVIYLAEKAQNAMKQAE